MSSEQWSGIEPGHLQQYRQQVRLTLTQLSDRALAYQDTLIRGGIDREECDREIARRRAKATPQPKENA